MLVELGSPADAKAFTNEPSLKEAMSSVVGAPDISFRERADEVIY